MNRFKASKLFSVKSSLIAGFLFLILIAGIVSGCVTQKQVRDIVAESNAALVTATIMGTAGADPTSLPHPGLGTEAARSEHEPWMVPSAKIDAFIESYPDQKVTASALRVRQAMLLLVHEQYNLARTAFNMVEPQYLTTARDKALYNLHTHLIWWFRVSRSPIMSLSELREADKALEALQAEGKTLDESPGIRDYLAEMRVWIALLCARSITKKDKAKAYLEDGINNYAKIFPAEDLSGLKMASEPSDWNVSMQAVRRRLRAKAIIDYAKNVIEKQRIEPEFESSVFAELIKSNP